MGPTSVFYEHKSPYGAHVGPDWAKCTDSALMGPIYTCLLGSVLDHSSNGNIAVHKVRNQMDAWRFDPCNKCLYFSDS